MSKINHRKETDKAIRNLINYSKQQHEWQERFSDVFVQLLLPAAEDLGIEIDDLMQNIESAGFGHLIFGYVFEDFATVHWGDEKHNFIDEYLRRRGWRESAIGRRYLQALGDSKLELWEIVNLKSGAYAEIRPYGSRQKSIKVVEKSATKSLQKWDGIVARVIKIDNTFVFTGSLLPLPPIGAEEVYHGLEALKSEIAETFHQLLEDKEIDEIPNNLPEILEYEADIHLAEIALGIWIEHLYESMNETMPALRNSDGDTFELLKLRFKLTAPVQKIAQALNNIPELDQEPQERVWIWLPCPANEVKEFEPVSMLGRISLSEKYLELESNSNQRLEKGHEWLLDTLGDMLAQPLVVHENIRKAMRKNAHIKKNANDSSDALSDEEQYKIIKTFYHKHYRKVLDEPVPMLQGKTPRECAADAALHESVVQWLKQLENSSAKLDTHQYDFSWVWEELGLQQYKN